MKEQVNLCTNKSAVALTSHGPVILFTDKSAFALTTSFTDKSAFALTSHEPVILFHKKETIVLRNKPESQLVHPEHFFS